MSARISQPLNQQRHSNVAVVRLTKKSAKLEIACYKNKALAWRNGTEKVLDEVLQIDRIFTNVGRGEYASSADITKVLGVGFDDPRKAITFILDHGELQIAHQERSSEIESIARDACVFVAKKCVHPESHQPYSVAVIEQAARDIGFSWKIDQPKKQALLLIHELVEKQPIPIIRARMRLAVTVPSSAISDLPTTVEVESTATGEEGTTVVGLIKPEQFRAVDAWAVGIGGSVAVINDAVTANSSSTEAAEGAIALVTSAEKARATIKPAAKSAAPVETVESSDSEGGNKKGVRRKRKQKTAAPSAAAPEEPEEEMVSERKKKKKRPETPPDEPEVDEFGEEENV